MAPTDPPLLPEPTENPSSEGSAPEDPIGTDPLGTDPLGADPLGTDPLGSTDPGEALASEEDAEPEPRRYPSTIGGGFYIAILITAGVAVGIVTGHDWRLGVKLLAASLGAAGLLRLLLPQRDAGMLAVRPKPIDVALLVAVAVVLWWLASTIPDQPT